MMTKLRRAAVLAELVGKLRDHGSWAGETHIQKACYFAQEMLHVPFGFSFILYRHGPFSFDLRDELTSLRANEILKLEPQPLPYGPKIAPTEHSADVRKRFPKTLGRYEEKLAFVAEKLGSRGVAVLERLATALFVTLGEGQDQRVEERSLRLCRLKPHVSEEQAQGAVQEIDTMLSELPG